MYRDTKNNLLYFRLPPDFVDTKIEERYDILLKKYSSPFKSVREFLNSLIVNFSFPPMTYDTVQQQSPTQERNYRTGIDLQRTVDKSFTIDFRLTEGMMSYFMMQEIFEYWNSNEINEYLPDFKLKTLDLHGNEMADITYSQILFTSLGEISMSFSDLDPSFNTFSTSFISNLRFLDPLPGIKHLQ